MGQESRFEVVREVEEFDDGGVRELDYFEGTNLAFVDYIHPRAIVQKGFKKMVLAIIPGVKPSKYKGNLSVKKTPAVEKKSKGTGKIEKTYSCPSGYRKGVRDEAWDKAKGKVIDPGTVKVMNKEVPWEMGHKPGYEFRKHQQSAQERGISRKEFLDEHNNPDHYRPELPSSNRSHKGEDLTGNYFGD